jgi:predicted dehydrogenase
MEMTTAAADSPNTLALIDHELRFQPGRIRAKQLLEHGDIGKVRHTKAIFQTAHRADPDLQWNWWSDASAGGGALGAIASHVIDSFFWFLNADITSVFCQLHTHIKERRDADGKMRAVTSDDESNMLLQFGDSEMTTDATGLVSISMTEAPKYRNRMEFFGEKGSIRVDELGEVYIAKRNEQDWTKIPMDPGQTSFGIADTGGFARAFWGFAPVLVDTVLNGDRIIKNAATFADGLRVQRVLDAAVDSNRSACAVKLTL